MTAIATTNGTDTDGTQDVLTEEQVADATALLGTLTADAKAGLAQAASGFEQAATAIKRIREERLVETAQPTDDKGNVLDFQAYCLRNFALDRAAADRYAQAADVIAAIRKHAPDTPLPVGEGQTRKLATLLKRPQGAKEIGSVWKAASAKASEVKGVRAIPTGKLIADIGADKGYFAVSAPKAPEGLDATLHAVYAKLDAEISWDGFLEIAAAVVKANIGATPQAILQVPAPVAPEAEEAAEGEEAAA